MASSLLLLLEVNLMKNYYFVIRSEYIYDLKLHGIERDTFAVVDSCFHAGSRWRGSTAKLAYMIGASSRSVERSIKSLIDNNFICMLNDGSFIPSESALAILDKHDKMSEACDKMSRQNVVQKKEAKKTEINKTNNTDSSNTEVISDEELNSLLGTLAPKKDKSSISYDIEPYDKNDYSL